MRRANSRAHSWPAQQQHCDARTVIGHKLIHIHNMIHPRHCRNFSCHKRQKISPNPSTAVVSYPSSLWTSVSNVQWVYMYSDLCCWEAVSWHRHRSDGLRSVRQSSADCTPDQLGTRCTQHSAAPSLTQHILPWL